MKKCSPFHFRRLLIRGICTLTSLSPIKAAFAQRGESESIESEQYSDQRAADKWMTVWMQALNSVTGVLHVGRFADRVYFLTKRIEWSPDPGQSSQPVVVPPGFVTDFASIPKIFWSLLPPDGTYTYAAIIHDFLYWEQARSRKEADRVFLYVMEDFGVNSVVASSIHAAVRVGGRFAWTENSNLKRAGEGRILKRYPDTPLVNWNDWKQNPAVFE